MKLFYPERVFFEHSALQYPLGREIYDRFKNTDIEVIETSIQNVIKKIPGENEKEKFARAKKSLVISVNKKSKFDVCKPSADYQFSLVSNCPGTCEYCYLQTTQAYKPYLRVFVNLEEIFDTIKEHIKLNNKDSQTIEAKNSVATKNTSITENTNIITTFEAASLGDPLSLEHITGSLAKTIEFFGTLDNGRLRVVTKFDNVDTLLNINHNAHTHFRFSLNSNYVINSFEHNTTGLDERITAASKLAAVGYPIGFIIAPIFIYNGWKAEYAELFSSLKEKLGNEAVIDKPISFELIQHRFTATAKEFILQRYPNTKLDLNEESRQLKWGKFGRYKYVYPKEKANEIKVYLTELIKSNFPSATIEYFT